MRFDDAEMVAPVYFSIFGITSNGTLSPSQPIVCNDDVPTCNLTRVIMLSRFNRTPNVTHSGIIPQSSRGNLYITHALQPLSQVEDDDEGKGEG